MPQGLASLPFLSSRAKESAQSQLVSAGPRVPRATHADVEEARPLARSAVRVPDGLHATTGSRGADAATNLFVHEGARQQLEKILRRVLGQRIVLAITDHRRTMVAAREAPEGIAVGVHHMFLDADPFTQQSLGRYLKDGDPAAGRAVDAYIAANQQRIRAPKPRGAVSTRGQRHDLQSIFDLLNDSYFQGMVDATISWGRRLVARSGLPRRSIRLGAYCADRKIIRIHPVLDRSWVPRYFVEYVVFHEMLHHMIPMPLRGGKRELHPIEFRQSERRYRHYARALAWERRNVARLLRT